MKAYSGSKPGNEMRPPRRIGSTFYVDEEGYSHEIKAIDDFIERLQAAIKSLEFLASEAFSVSDHDRLVGKAQGVRLALSYAKEMAGNL